MEREEGPQVRQPGYAKVWIEALEAYGQFCIEAAADASDGDMQVEVPDWTEYLTDYLLAELEESD